MNMDAIETSLAEQSTLAVSLTDQHTAILVLFQAAVLENKADLADTYREQAHDLLDLLLDCISTIQMLHRQLMHKK